MKDNGEALVVGLTGQTGAGKTTVSKAFADAGFVLINCDHITRELQSRPEIISRLAGAFGRTVLQEDGSLNRRALAAAAFSSPEQTQKLAGIMYPPVLAEIEKRIDEFSRNGQKLILLDAPTLFESGAAKFCRKKVAVLAAEDLRLMRIMERDHLTEEQARSRMSAQHPDAYYTIRCDYTLHNNSAEEELARLGKELAETLAGSMKKKMGQDLKTVLIALALTLGTILLITGCYTLASRALYPQKYQEEVTAAAEEFSLDPNLIYAVIRCESHFKPDAVSSVGARGLMQITEDAYDWAKYRMDDTDDHTYDDIYDPALNIRYGSSLLSLLLDEFGSERNAVAAYHAGFGNVEKWLSDQEYSGDGVNLDEIPFPTTSQYVEDVLQTQKVYSNLYD